MHSTKEVVLRFRHPKSAPIKAVTLKGLTGTMAVTAQY